MPTDRLGGRRLRPALVLALAALPWSVQAYDAGAPTLLFPWGMVSVDPLRVTGLHSFLFRHASGGVLGLPRHVFAWPLSALCYALALASATVGAPNLNLPVREDARLTVGLLALAGLAQLSVARGFAVQPGRTAYPLGTAALWAVAWYVRRSARRERGRT